MSSLKKRFIQKPFLSAGFSAWKLAAEGFANESKKYRRKQQRKSSYHAILHPRFALRWFAFLKSPDFSFVVTHRPRLYLKPFRVYMSTRWTKDQKIKVILDTYRFMLTKGESFKELIVNDRLEFLHFQMKDGVEAVITLGYDSRYRKEGELVFALECEQLGGIITSAAFSFEETKEEGWICRIGCVQGHSKKDLYLTKEVQKMLNGLRPKSLMVFVVQEFSRQLGFSAVYGAGDLIQAYRKKHAIHLARFHSISFDYNTFWSECGGQDCADGWYKLPLQLVQKEMKDIKTTKRAVYRRRYEQLDRLSSQIAEAVQQLIL